MANNYTTKSKGIVKSDSTGISPSIEALFGPWNSFEEFRSYLSEIILQTATDDDIPNGIEIGIKQPDSTVKRYKWKNPDSVQASWVLSDAVESVNGKTGTVTLSKSDIGLGDVDNTPDANKNVNSAVKDGSGNNIVSTYETKEDATTKNTNIQSALDGLQTSVGALTGLDSTNFGGFSIESTEADAISNIATLYTADGYTDELLWYMAGTSLSSVKAYRYNGSGTPTLISNDSYDCIDFSGLSTTVNNLRLSVLQLTSELEDTKQILNIFLASLGEYAFPNGKPTIGNQFVVNQSLTGITSNYNNVTVEKYGTLEITLTPNSQRDIYEVSVLMDNVDITSQVYDNTTNVISIDRVTGDVSIVATSVPSTSNYVQSGLIFHLDGILQGSNPNAWTDLIGNIVFSNNGAVKNGKGWYFDGASCFEGANNTPSFDPSANTIEVCFESELTNTTYYLFMDGGGQIMFNYIYDYNTKDFYVTKGTQASGTGFGALRPSTNDSRDNGNGKKIISYNGKAQSTSGAGYINGIKGFPTSLSNTSVSGYPRVGCRFRAGEYQQNTNFFKGTIYSIRVYNRQLTTAEMLANQRVDNERFGFNLSI